MIVRVDGRTHRGRALDVHGVPPSAVADAIRGIETESGSPVAVRAPEPGPLFERVGVVANDASVSVRAALAAAARSRGMATPHDGELADRRAELRSLDPPEVDREAARERVANAGEREAHLHERVAQLRGRVRTLRERGAETAAAEDRLRDATAALTEARTERIAAEEELDRLERRLRAARDDRERRLELRDRIDNLRRSARRHLAARLWTRFRAAVEAVPGDAEAGEEPGTYRGDDCTAALAALRVGDPVAPAVLACGRFPDATTAAERLDATVIRVRP